MDVFAITLGIIWTSVGVLIIALSIPLVRRRISPNPFYGVRFPQSFQSDDAWYAINHFGGKRLSVWSLPIIAIGIISFFLPLRSHSPLRLTVQFAPLIISFIPLLESWRFARRYRPK